MFHQVSINATFLTHFPIADNKMLIFPSGLVERFVRPIFKQSGPKDLFKIACSKECGAISRTTASLGI